MTGTGTGILKTGITLALAASAALLAPHQLAAQDQAVREYEDGTLVYEAAYFAQFSPGNALQMAQRVPGFTLESGSTEMRGFAGAAGNVVINGQRPSAKSDNLATVLGRIPASRVARIELGSGNRFGSDYVGKPQVLNIVLTDEGGLAGTIAARLNREYTGRLLPRGNANLTYTTGAHTFDAGVEFSLNSIFSEEGFDRVTLLPSGDEIEFRDVNRRNTEPWTILSAGWGMEQAADRNAHLTAKISFDKWTLEDRADVTGPGLGYDAQFYYEDHLWRTWEISGDVSRPLAGGAVKFNAFATHRHRRNDDFFEQSLGETDVGGFVQDFDDYRDERLVRLAWKHGGLRGWTAEIGAEGAFNRLESQLDIFDVDAAGNRTPVNLPIEDAVVREYRGEAFVNAGRALTDSLRLDLALNYEYSELEVSGDAIANRTLRFLKPKAAVNWSPGQWHAQFSVERTVAQLQFGDFVSSSSFNTGQVNGGNAELEPQRKWEFLLSADRTILGDGRVKLDLGYNAVSRVQDRIPLKVEDPVTGEMVNSGLDAPGNLGSGSEWIAKANLDLPLASLGIRGGRLSLTGAYLDTSVLDPYTLDYRPFTGTKLFVYSAGLRQDLEKFAWGIDVTGDTGATFYRLRETDESMGLSPAINAFVEYRPFSRTTLTLGVENVLDGTARRWRYFYAPDRTSTDPVRLEYRERQRHPTIYVGARYSFG